MAEAAEAHRSCKFFAMKDLLETAELVLCPYNYVFDPGIRNALGIELGNAAVIIDEGHNVEDVCREGASFECSLKDLDEGVRELRSVVGFYSEADPALVFMELMYTWLDKHLREAKGQNRAEGRFHGGGYRKLSGPVTPGPEERLWKGEDGERALLAALCPTLASAGGNPESLRKHALMCVDNAIRVADYTSSLRQKINNTGKSFGESSLGKCYNAAKAVRSLLTNPRDYVLYAVPDLDHPGDDGFNAQSQGGFARGSRRGRRHVVPPPLRRLRSRVRGGHVRHRHQRDPVTHRQPRGRARGAVPDQGGGPARGTAAADPRRSPGRVGRLHR